MRTGAVRPEFEGKMVLDRITGQMVKEESKHRNLKELVS